MRPLVVWNLVTLDGCFEGPEPWSIDHFEEVWGEELEAFCIEQMAEVGTLLLGRRTCEGLADHWRGLTGPIADPMNSVEKAVATRTLDAVDWANARVLRGEASELVPALKAADRPGGVFVFGSADLVSTLLEADLVDEYRLFLIPIVLGAGNPLFKDGLPRRDFDLAEARPFASGGMLLRYARRDG